MMTYLKTIKVSALVGLAALGTAAYAQDADENGWSGEGSLSAGVTTGNTETTDLGLGVDATRKMNL